MLLLGFKQYILYMKMIWSHRDIRTLREQQLAIGCNDSPPPAKTTTRSSRLTGSRLVRVQGSSGASCTLRGLGKRSLPPLLFPKHLSPSLEQHGQPERNGVESNSADSDLTRKSSLLEPWRGAGPSLVITKQFRSSNFPHKRLFICKIFCLFLSSYSKQIIN